MAPKTIRTVLAETLEDLSSLNFDKFCRQLLDRREEPRVRRNKVEGKNFLDLADVLVSTFTEEKALRVAVEILRQIDCNEDADRLAKSAGSGGTAGSSGGATGENTTAPRGCSGKHFVDEHKVELTKRVSNVSPILDDLLEENVIQEELYDHIRSLRTSQERMRELFSGPLRASVACKDIFYKILEKNEPFLIKDLTQNN